MCLSVSRVRPKAAGTCLSPAVRAPRVNPFRPKGERGGNAGPPWRSPWWCVCSRCCSRFSEAARSRRRVRSTLDRDWVTYVTTNSGNVTPSNQAYYRGMWIRMEIS